MEPDILWHHPNRRINNGPIERRVWPARGMVVDPGQLTAYDSGALEILALRAMSEVAIGDDFDIREFHQWILENGTIPLPQLRAHVESWIENYQALH